MTDEPRRPDKTGGLLIGTTIMLIGVTLLLDRTGIISGVHYTAFWGLLVMTVGLVKLSQVRENGRREGGWWLFFGVWMLLNETRVWRFRESWPLLLVAFGISMAWKEIVRRRPPAQERLK